MLLADDSLGAVNSQDLTTFLRTRLALTATSRRSGVSYRQIAAELAGQVHRTKRDRSWHASTVRAVWERRAVYRPLLASTGVNPIRGGRLTGLARGG